LIASTMPSATTWFAAEVEAVLEQVAPLPAAQT
jgi:hypothetical protein